MSQYEEHYIEDEGEYFREISTNSFLAGILYCKKSVDFMNEYFKLQEDFENKYKISVVGQEDLNVNIVVEGTSIRLIDDYNKIINVDGKVMSVGSYLYLLTTPEVREYFNIEDTRSAAKKNCWNYFFDNKRKIK